MTRNLDLDEAEAVSVDIALLLPIAPGPTSGRVHRADMLVVAVATSDTHPLVPATRVEIGAADDDPKRTIEQGDTPC